MNHKVKLKDIAKITSGSNAPKEEDFSESGLPFVRAGHLESLIGGLDIRNLPKVNEVTSKNLKLRKAPKDSVLFAKSGMSCKKNRVYKTNDESFIVNHLACITPESENITNDYLKCFIEWYKPSRLIRDESYPSIRLSDISNIELELPSLSAQSKITKTLNLAVKIIQIRQQQIESLSALKQSIYLDMFGDPITNPKSYIKKSLKEIGKITTGNTPPRKDKDNYGDYIEWIKTNNISDNSIYLTQALEYLSEKGMSIGRVVPENSILVTCIAGSKSSIGRVAIANREVAFNQQINAITPSEKIDTAFLFTQIKMLKPYIQSFSTNSMKGMISKTNFEKIEVIFPTLEEQLKFRHKFNQIISIEEKLKNSLNNIEEMYDSLLYNAFNGELFKDNIKV